MKSKWKLKWNLKPQTNLESEESRITGIFTLINQISAQIHMKTQMGGANKIKINQKLYDLIKGHEYFESLKSKYEIIIEEVGQFIYVYKDDTKTTKVNDVTYILEKDIDLNTEGEISVITEEDLVGEIMIYNVNGDINREYKVIFKPNKEPAAMTRQLKSNQSLKEFFDEQWERILFYDNNKIEGFYIYDVNSFSYPNSDSRLILTYGLISNNE